MRGLSLALAVLAATTLAGPVGAANFSSVAGAPGPIGAAQLPPSLGGDAPRARSRRNHGPENGLASPNPGVRQSSGLRRRGAFYGSGDHLPAVDGSHRIRRYWFGGGPVLVPDSSSDYLLGDVDYDDGGDPTGCTVFRKASDGDGRFLGWVPIDLCDAP